MAKKHKISESCRVCGEFEYECGCTKPEADEESFDSKANIVFSAFDKLPDYYANAGAL